MRLFGTGGAGALENPGRDHVDRAKVFFADGANPPKGGRWTAVGATGDFHDIVGSRRGEDHRVNPLARAERASAKRAGLPLWKGRGVLRFAGG